MGMITSGRSVRRMSPDWRGTVANKPFPAPGTSATRVYLQGALGSYEVGKEGRASMASFIPVKRRQAVGAWREKAGRIGR